MNQNLKNDRFIRALWRKPVDRTPVWIMRQAGRYMPEYRALRAKAGKFLTLCKTPELACEATMLPIRRFELDAAILFSDILLIPEAMGLGLEFVEGEGPVFAKTIRNENDIADLKSIDPDTDMGYVTEAIKLIVKEINGDLPLIGFAGSPWTVCTYMVEGQTSKQFNHIKGLMYQAPKLMHALLSHMTNQIVNCLIAQIKAGVNAVMLFDTWGGLLSDHMYKEFSLKYMSEIVSSLKAKYPNIPIILFTKNGGRCVLDIAQSGCDAIGLD